jgi:hypothetical protein
MVHMILEETIAEMFSLQPANVHYTVVYSLGLVVQGLYQWYCSGDFRIDLFLLYFALSFAASLLYFRVFAS